MHLSLKQMHKEKELDKYEEYISNGWVSGRLNLPPKKNYNKHKAIKNEYGRTEKQELAYLNKRQKERPDINILIEEIKNNSINQLSKKYNVTWATIIRWLKYYNIDYKNI